MPALTPRRTATERLLNAPHTPVAAYLVYVGGKALHDPDANRLAPHQVPDLTLYLWASLLALGGALIIAGVATGHTRAESAGHGMHLAGLAAYASAAAVAGLSIPNVVVTVLVLAAVSTLRLRQLSKLRRGRYIAQALVNGDKER